MIPAGQHYRLPVDYSFVSSVKFFYYESEELDIIRRVKPGEKILVFVESLAKLRKLRDILKQDGHTDVVCLCSRYRKEAKEFDQLKDVLQDHQLLHTVTLTTSVLYNGVDIKDPALKHIVSELWNPLVNAQILGRKRPTTPEDTCDVYFMQYGQARLKGIFEQIKTYQFEPTLAFRKKAGDESAWQAYLNDDKTQQVLSKSRTVVLDARKGRYCLRKRAYVQALLEASILERMIRDGYRKTLLRDIDPNMLEKLKPLDPPLLLEYLENHLEEERLVEDWKKIFLEMGHIYNRKDGHVKKSPPGFETAQEWLNDYGYVLHSKQSMKGVLRKKMVWWVTKESTNDG